MSSILAELKRRNVLRVAAAYALVAWILIEAGSVLLPTFGAPEWIFKAYVMVVAAGFVVSLIVAWVFEITPDGVKRERDVDRNSNEPRAAGRFNTVIIGLLLIALAVSVTFNFTGIRDTPQVAKLPSKRDSIAVLPFENRSPNAEDRFFADGIHEDILTRLANIEALRVISGTSVGEYRNTEKSARQIGDELGVTTILLGAVQRAGDKVRITVQLVDATTDQYIWTDTFDRGYTLHNVFDLQSAISSQIAESLQAALTPQDKLRLASVPTLNADAYVEYVQGILNLTERKYDTLIEARKQFERAVELDPEYAMAHAKLAETILIISSNHAAIQAGDALSVAESHLATALQLDPDLASAHAALGLLEMSRWERDRTGNKNLVAANAYKRALQLNPSLADAYVWFATLRADEGNISAAVDLLTKALAIDPRSRIPYVNLPSFLTQQGQNDEAIELLLEATRIFPDWETPYSYLSTQLQQLGRLDEAVAWGLKAKSLSTDPMAASQLVPVYQEFDDQDAISQFMEGFPADHPLYPIGKSYWHYMLREYTEALAELERLPPDSDVPTQFYLPLQIGAAILLHDYDRAYNYLSKGNPDLTGDADPVVNRFNVRSAVLLAFIQQKRNQFSESSMLLDKAEPIIWNLPRLGMSGHGIKDVQVLTLKGQYSAALDALEEAVNEGFVSSRLFDGWAFDEDPIIQPLRTDPRFDELRERIENRIDSMRQNVDDARRNNDWSQLLAGANST